MRLPSMIGELPIPDPRTWPTEATARFRELTGPCGSLDVFIFVSGPAAAMYLHDSVAALGILDVDPSEWHTEGGYPAFQFAAKRISEYSRRLTQCGYNVRIVGMAGTQQSVGMEPRAEIVEISSGRCWRKTV